MALCRDADVFNCITANGNVVLSFQDGCKHSTRESTASDSIPGVMVRPSLENVFPIHAFATNTSLDVEAELYYVGVCSCEIFS